MVRKTAMILLATFAAPVFSQPNPFDKYDIEGAAWVGYTTTNDTFWILEKEIDRDSSLGGGVTFWLRGDHSRNMKLKYRKSLWKVRMTCRGSFYTTATSHIDADGVSIYEWDGYGKETSIRPDTIYETIQDKLCPK